MSEIICDLKRRLCCYFRKARSWKFAVRHYTFSVNQLHVKTDGITLFTKPAPDFMVHFAFHDPILLFLSDILKSPCSLGDPYFLRHLAFKVS